MNETTETSAPEKRDVYAHVTTAQGHLIRTRTYVREGLLLLAYQQAELAQLEAFEAKAAVDRLLKSQGAVSRGEWEQAQREAMRS